ARLKHVRKQRWAGRSGGSRRGLFGKLIPRPTQPTGVLGLVLGKQAAEHLAGALIEEGDKGKIPVRIAPLELGEMTVVVRHLEAATVDNAGAVTLALHAPLGPGEGKPQRGAIGARPHDARSYQEAPDRGLAGLGMDLVVVLVLGPGERRLVEFGEAQIGHMLEHGHQPAFNRGPEDLDLGVLRWAIWKRRLL